MEVSTNCLLLAVRMAVFNLSEGCQALTSSTIKSFCNAFKYELSVLSVIEDWLALASSFPSNSSLIETAPFDSFDLNLENNSIPSFGSFSFRALAYFCFFLCFYIPIVKTWRQLLCFLFMSLAVLDDHSDLLSSRLNYLLTS